MTAVATAPRRATHTRPLRVTFPRLLRSEVIKILSLRSTWWSLGVTAALSVGISFLIAAASSGMDGGFPAATVLLAPTQFTMLVAGILGAIVVTGEYSTGMIRSTLTAEPRRGAVMLAKALVVAAVMAATTVVIYAVASVITMPMLSAGLDWSQPEQSLVPLVLGATAMAAFTLMGLGFGFLLRSGAGAIATTVGVLFVLPIVLGLFTFAGPDWQWIVDAGEYLPSSAASQLMSPGGEQLAQGAISLAAWVAAPLVLGYVALRSRDA